MFCKISFTPTVTSCYHVHADAHLSVALVCYLDETGAETSDAVKLHTAGVGNCFWCSGATLRRPHLPEGRAFL